MLEQNMKNNQGGQAQMQQFGMLFQRPQSLMSLEIVDYSPEWDFTQGGAKILVCLKPSNLLESIDLSQTSLQLAFGQVSVPVTLLQPGVLKCNAPAHEAGFVDIRLLING